MTAVPLIDLGRQHAALAPALRAAFDRVLATGGFVGGPDVAGFEDAWAAYCGTTQCVGVASGTAALTIALRAAGIGPGDEVVVPAHTFIASALAVVHAGAEPVLCDVREQDALMDVAAAAAAVGPRTAAIMPVHLYGRMCDMRAVGDLAQRHGLFVLEDAAQAHGATRDGMTAGAAGNAAAFSFYPSKNLGALGDAGAICTGDETLAARARRLRDLGRQSKQEHVAAGRNDRLDGLQAAALRIKLDHLDAWNAARRDHARLYRDLLGGTAVRLPADDQPGAVHHVLAVRSERRDALAAGLRAGGVATGVHYPLPVHRQPVFADTAVGAGSFPVAEAWAREELSLPMFPELRRDEVERVAGLCASLAA